MSLNSYNPLDRYRRRGLQRMTGIMTVIGLIILFAVVGFYFGKERALQDKILLSRQVETMTAERTQMEETLTKLRSEVQTANMRLDTLKKNYESAVPAGAARDLISLVTREITEGADPERLAFLIRSGRPPRNCKDPETRRFIVATPTYSGAQSQISVADGAILIKSSGVSARNASGAPEAWYDPAKPVHLEFTVKDGRVEKKSGVMPISHTIVLEGREYRFTAAEGVKSFAKVTFDSCDYP